MQWDTREELPRGLRESPQPQSYVHDLRNGGESMSLSHFSLNINSVVVVILEGREAVSSLVSHCMQIHTTRTICN